MNKRRAVLFLCTGNSCRSQMAEAMLRHCGDGRFEAHSAGSHPAGFIHPITIACLERMGIPLSGDQESKSWSVYEDTAFDAVITLCDSAAAAGCPVWPGHPVQVHWSTPDPVLRLGTPEERMAFAMRVAERLRAKIDGLVGLDWSANPIELKRSLEFLGEV